MSVKWNDFGGMKVGVILKTSYGTGSYLVQRISEICTCPSYTASLNGDDSPSKPHYHFTLKDLDKRGGTSWLNGYAPGADGVWRSVWNDEDYLIIDVGGVVSDYIDETGTQLDLF